MKMKKWEAIELQNSAINFILDVSNNKWIFTDMTLGTFLQPLKDSKEHWIFFTEMIYKLYKCDMIEFPDDEEFPVRLLVGLPGSLEEFWTNSIEEFCCLLANRFEYRKTDMAYQPYIYPKEITRFYGARNTSVTRCFILQAENERTLFSFFNVGSIRLKTNQAASACNQS